MLNTAVTVARPSSSPESSSSTSSPEVSSGSGSDFKRESRAAFELRRGGEIDFSHEFLIGSQLIKFSSCPIVTVFGSARPTEHHPHYKLGVKTGSELALAGFSVLTGAGFGLMQAANQGAFEARMSGKCVPGVESLGVKIQLPFEQRMNPFLTHDGIVCKYFAPRKVGLVKNSVALVVLPGGLGSADEIVETIKVATRLNPPMPVVFVGDFWKPFLSFIRLHPEGPVKQGYLDEASLRDVYFVSSERELPELILDKSAQRIERYHNKRQDIENGVVDADGMDWNMATNLDARLNQCIDQLQELCPQYPLACVSSREFVSPALGDTLRKIGKLIQLRGLPIMVPKAAGSMNSYIEGFFDGSGSRGNSLPAFALDLHGDPSGIYGDGLTRLFPGYHLLQEFLLGKATAGAIIGPGGLGSLAFALELADLQTTEQTGDYRSALVGSKFWKACFDSIRECAYQEPGFNNGRGGWDYVSWDKLWRRALITDDPCEAVNWAIGSDKAMTRFARFGQIPLPVLSSLPPNF